MLLSVFKCNKMLHWIKLNATQNKLLLLTITQNITMKSFKYDKGSVNPYVLHVHIYFDSVSHF